MDGSGDCRTAAPEIWGTLEDLLLASAVRLHGACRWDSVAMEVRSRTPYGDPFNSGACEHRFRHLQRKFSSLSLAAGEDNDNKDGDDVPWFEDLRRLRIAELRRELDRSDVSIMSLQQKVKKLEEECRHGDVEGQDAGGDPNPNNLEMAGESVNNRFPDGDSGRSCNESNSTDPKESGNIKRDNEESPPVEAVEASVRAADEKSCNESDSGAGGGSETQSSASLARLRQDPRRRVPAGEADMSAQRGDDKSGPLIALLQLIRSSYPGSVFECRLESQESSRYRKLIRRHVDLEMIQSKLDGEPTYTATELFRDLMLLCANATVYYPKRSPEYTAGVKLRRIITREMTFFIPSGKAPKTEDQPPVVTNTTTTTTTTTSSSSSLAGKMPPALPLMVACRKRSSVASQEEKEKESEKEKLLNAARVGGDLDGPARKMKPGATKGLRTNKSRGGGGAGEMRSRESSMKNSLLSRSPTPLQMPPEIEKAAAAVVLPPLKGVKKNAGGSKKAIAVQMLRKIIEKSSSESPPSLEKKESSMKTRQRLSDKGKRSVGRPPKRQELRKRRPETEIESPLKKRGRRG